MVKPAPSLSEIYSEVRVDERRKKRKKYAKEKFPRYLRDFHSFTIRWLTEQNRCTRPEAIERFDLFSLRERAIWKAIYEMVSPSFTLEDTSVSTLVNAAKLSAAPITEEQIQRHMTEIEQELGNRLANTLKTFTTLCQQVNRAADRKARSVAKIEKILFEMSDNEKDPGQLDRRL